MRIATCLFSIGVLLALTPPAEAAEQCKDAICASSSATKTANGWKVDIKIRIEGGNRYEFFQMRIHGHSQIEKERSSRGEFNLNVPADWDGTYIAQACMKNSYHASICDGWSTFTTELPKAQPALSTPDRQFCNWYASEAVARAGQGAKCGLTGARWNPNTAAHFRWCMGQKAQQQAWGEHNARLAGLADCTRKEVDAAPPVQLQSAGAPMVTVKQDVDVYKEPGGAGQSIGILKSGSRPQMYETRPDQWCRLAGKDVPGGGGWVWCGEGFELQGHAPVLTPGG